MQPRPARPGRRVAPSCTPFCDGNHTTACDPGRGRRLKIGPRRATLPPMAEKYLCMLCDKPESECKCDRYCALCQGAYDVRLVQDGQYMCRDCREACDYQAQAE